VIRKSGFRKRIFAHNHSQKNGDDMRMLFNGKNRSHVAVFILTRNQQ
jgi:hypothetical protein